MKPKLQRWLVKMTQYSLSDVHPKMKEAVAIASMEPQPSCVAMHPVLAEMYCEEFDIPYEDLKLLGFLGAEHTFISEEVPGFRVVLT